MVLVRYHGRDESYIEPLVSLRRSNEDMIGYRVKKLLAGRSQTGDYLFASFRSEQVDPPKIAFNFRCTFFPYSSRRVL